MSPLRKPCVRVLILLAAIVATIRAGESPAFRDTTLSFEQRARALVAELTSEEKAQLLDHAGPDVERLKIRSDRWNQCLHGVWWDEPTTMFPVPIAMAATFDVPLVHRVASAISDEARAIYNGWHLNPQFHGEHKGLIYRAPVINISRNPYWGRIDECYGEDCYLTGRMGVAFVTGLQGDDPKYLKLAATLKHYAVNNVEHNRTGLSATVGERWLHEFWLPHFRDCIVEGHAQSVMASYNAINGVPNNVSQLMLTEILKQQWGFDGFVVSDLGGVKTMVQDHDHGKVTFEEAVGKSLMAGCDFSDKEYRLNAAAALKLGFLSEERLDDAVYRVMRDRLRLGDFDPPALVPFSAIKVDEIDSAAHRQLALETAHEAIVLLTNREHFLPLDRAMVKSIAVIGPHAGIFTSGDYAGVCSDPINPLQGVHNRAAAGTAITHAIGAAISVTKRKDNRQNQVPVQIADPAAELAKAVAAAKQADVAIVYVGTTMDIEWEGRDRNALGLPGDQEELVEQVVAANPRTVVVLMNGGPLTIPWIKEHAPAVIEAWWCGEEGGNAIADVIFGTVNPAGRLPLTVYASPAQVPPIDEYDPTKGFTYLYLRGAPLYPFGHGLSYTTFAYSALTVSPVAIPGDGVVQVSVTVANSGHRAGDEVVQLYVHDRDCRVTRPGKELRGIARISLAAGESRVVTMSIAGRQLAFYDDQVHGFVVEPGSFDIMVGSSSEDIRVQEKVTVNSPGHWKP